MKSLLHFTFYASLLLLMIPSRVAAQALSPLLQSSLDSVFKTWDTAKTPGAVVAVIKDGQIVYQRAYGMAHVAHQEKLTVNHAFWVASMSKQFTAMSIALLAEAGKLRLNDDIRKYLPQLPDLGDTVRIHHLIHHTSGLRDGFTLIGLRFKGEKHYTNAKVVAAMAQQKRLNFKPGTRYEYLDSGYVLLAEIVEKVSGLPFAAFTEATIFRPLGMTHTQFAGNFKNPAALIATGYGVQYKNNQVKYRPQRFKGNSVGSTGLITTIADLAKWDANFYQNQLGKKSLELIKQLIAPTPLNNGTLNKYGFGLEIGYYQNYFATTHSGADPGYKAEMVRFPDQRLTLICLANTENVYSLTPKLLHLGTNIIQKKITTEQPKKIPEDQSNYSALTGYYLNPVNNYELSVISEAKGELFAATSLNGYKFSLVKTAPLHYQNQGLKENEWQFLKTEDGEVNQIQLKSLRENDYFLKKVRPQSFTPDQLKKYIGCYYSPELDKTYRLGIKKGKLGLKLFGLFHIPFQPLEGNRFLMDFIGNNSIIFQSDATGRITGFSFNRRAITNLAFTRKN
ncbi:serine hydrolase domain-containing protein [Adhaeribacter pallidiroseus]|uniref:N-acyl-D-amino-acid deacylase n=1 Tax=Adhaeribacter pallidiroseus TaxID=2072847 RepID=A0A369QGE3_9BACT|nr:serine hydrolase domain-containing protein [Adhaeribacter pallidiroseus]RDC63784.1 N-acyl-D-amino-acid deacylase [Adhaeribacter pallidiroseus]